MSSFEPIAIIGQSCLLPGAHSPKELWAAVQAEKDLLSDTPTGRWGVSDHHILCEPGSDSVDRCWSKRGGYVRGFQERFQETLERDPFALPSEQLLALDPLFHWLLWTAREALRDAGHDGNGERVGAVFGNLSYPSTAMARFAEEVWLQQNPHFGYHSIAIFTCINQRPEILAKLG